MCFVTSFRLKVVSAIFCGSFLCFGCNGNVAEPIDEPAPDATNTSEVSSADPIQSGADEPSIAGIEEDQHSFESHSNSAMAVGTTSELSSPGSEEQAEIPNPLGDRYAGYTSNEVTTSENSLAASSLLDWSDTNTEQPNAAAVHPPGTVDSRYPSGEDQVPSIQFDSPLDGEQHLGIESSDLPIVD